MDITIVVPTYNRREIVRRTLNTLFRQDASANSFEIIVVVDGSSDGTAEVLRELHPPCGFRVIEQQNRGLAGARNTGFRAAESNLVLFLDDDMQCDPGLVAAHVAAHRSGGNIIGFGALFLSDDSRQTIAAECFNREIGAFHLEQKQTPGTVWQMSDCVFSNSSLSRSLLEEAGGFDERFRMREDLELGVRLLQTGATPKYLPNAIAYQFYDKTNADLIRDAEAFAAADVLLAYKHPDAQIPGQLRAIVEEEAWKRGLRRIAAASPAVVDLLLAPVCALGNAFFSIPAMRDAGVRALQIRRRNHWFHRVLQLGMPANKL